MSSKNVANTPTGTRPLNDVEDFISFLNSNHSKALTKIFSFSFTATNFLKSGTSDNEKQRPIKCLVNVSSNHKININVGKSCCWCCCCFKAEPRNVEASSWKTSTQRKVSFNCPRVANASKSSQMTHSIKASDTQVHFVTA